MTSTFAATTRWTMPLIGVLACTLLSSCGGPVGGLKPGDQAPKIEAKQWINGEPPRPLEGRVLVVDAWSPFCRPCVDAMPKMLRLYNKYHPRGAVFIGLVSETSDRLSHVTKVLNDYQIPWPNAYGARDLFIEFRVRAIPQVWVIGRDGRIVWNRDSSEPIESAIERALADGEEPANPKPAAESSNESR